MIEHCKNCGFPLIKAMSTKPKSTNWVLSCVNCGNETQAIAEASNLQHLIGKKQLRKKCADKEIVTLISDFCCLDKSIIAVEC
jgi:hypothetical protein